LAEQDQIHNDKNRSRAKSGLTALWNRWKNRNAKQKLQTAVKALVASSIAGGLVLGSVGYVKAQDANNTINNLGNGVINASPPPDLTNQVNAAQSAADTAQNAASTAQSAANAAQSSAASAQSSAASAQATADQALAGEPHLSVFPSETLGLNSGVYIDPPAGSISLEPGVYIIEFGANAPVGGSSQARIRLSDGRIVNTASTFAGATFMSGKTILNITDTTTVFLEFDANFNNAGPYTLPYILTTKVLT